MEKTSSAIGRPPGGKFLLEYEFYVLRPEIGRGAQDHIDLERDEDRRPDLEVFTDQTNRIQVVCDLFTERVRKFGCPRRVDCDADGAPASRPGITGGGARNAGNFLGAGDVIIERNSAELAVPIGLGNAANYFVGGFAIDAIRHVEGIPAGA